MRRMSAIVLLVAGMVMPLAVSADPESRNKENRVPSASVASFDVVMNDVSVWFAELKAALNVNRDTHPAFAEMHEAKREMAYTGISSVDEANYYRALLTQKR